MRAGSAASRILEMSYDNHDDSDISEFSLFEMSKKIKKSYKYTKNIALGLKSSGHLESKGRGRYSITQKGRWFGLCQTLDSISFLSLCLLAEIYHNVKDDRYDKHSKRMIQSVYSFSSFRRCYEKKFGDLFSASVYSKSNVSKSLSHLTTRNLVYVSSSSRDMIKMTKPMIRFLSEYDDDLSSLYLWCEDTLEKCVTHTIENVSSDNLVRLG